MHTLKEISSYLKDMELEQDLLKKCYDLIDNAKEKVSCDSKLYLKCDTQYDINTISSYIQSITADVQIATIHKAIKSTANQFKQVHQKPRIAFYLVILSKIIN